MFEKVKNYFSISQREARGLVVVFLIMIIIHASPYIYEKYFFEPLEIKIQTLAPLVEEIETSSNNNYQDFSNDNEETSSEKAMLFKFNPNNLPIEDWVKLGLSEKQALSIKKYEAKGGKFYKNEDLKKMYSISDRQYSILEPYIDIPKQSNYIKSEEKEYNRPEAKRISVDINNADSIDLLEIKGVGPSFASRIIKYRNKLGGFVSKEQLREVYGVDSLKFDQIKEQLKIDTENIRKININQVTFEEFKKFPYLTYKQMNVLLAYRKQHGPFKEISEFYKIVPFNKDVINKISPYIKFND